MRERFAVTVIGVGRARLATGHYLTALGVEHVVLERGQVDETWRGDRWDSFTFVTPNWTVQLPGASFYGPPDGFTPGTEIVDYFERYAAAGLTPLGAGIQDLRIEPTGEGGFRLHLLSQATREDRK